MKVPAFAKKKIFYIPTLLAVLVAGGIFAFGGEKEPDYETEMVLPQTITQVVSETGVVRPVEDIPLSFARGGRVSEVLVSKGDVVSNGQTLAVLEGGAFSSDVRQARSALERQEIALQELLADPLGEDIALSENAIEIAEVTLENSRLGLRDAIASAYTLADDAVQAKADQLFNNPNSDSPTFGTNITRDNTTFYISTSFDRSRPINTLRREVEKELEELNSLVFDVSDSNIEEVATTAENTVQDVQELLSLIAGAMNEYVASDTDAQAVYEDFKADISTARSSVNSALSSLRSAMQTYYSARIALETPQRELDLKNADPISETIRLQEIAIEEARARLDSALSHINDGYIVAPISGLVTEVSISPGEIAGSASPSITVISDNELEISVNIPESDIAMVEVGDDATVTLDAYDDVEFAAKVSFISPTAELIEGLPSFETILELDQVDSRIRSGFSVDVEIISATEENVLAVPARALFTQDSQTYVRVVDEDGRITLREVGVGLRGSGGSVAIISGLEEGDEIITFISDEVLRALEAE